MVARIGGARIAIELLRPVGVAERDAEVGRRRRASARARSGLPLGRVDEQRDRFGRAGRGRAAASRARRRRARARDRPCARARTAPAPCPSRAASRARRRATSARARSFGSAIDVAEPLERRERLVLGDRRPRPRAARCPRARRGGSARAGRLRDTRRARRRRRRARARRSCAISRNSSARSLVALDLHGAAAEQIDQHRPLARRAIEHLERLERGVVCAARSSSTRSRQSAA